MRAMSQGPNLGLATTMTLTYFHLVLVFGGALLFLIIQLLLRKPWQIQSQGIEHVVNRSSSDNEPSDQEYLVPLMVYEERFPAFGKILDLVLSNFPLRRFMVRNDFERALYYLRNSVFQPSTPADLNSAMSLIVHTFLNDPDVEYHCRKKLHPLVNEFLRELESRAEAS